MDNVDEYSWIDEEGNFHLRSIEDELCEVVLSANCLHVRVNFLYMLQNKKGKWVTSAQNYQGQNFDDGVSENRSHVSRITQSVMSGNSERTMCMHYEYIRIEQIHSVAQIPSRWSYPLKLILSLKKLDPVSELFIQPIEEVLSPDLQAQEILRGKEYQTSLPTNPAHRVKSENEREHDTMMASIHTDVSSKSKFENDAAKSVDKLI